MQVNETGGARGLRPPPPAAPDEPGAHEETACRVREVLDRVGDKWSVAVIHQLGWGSRRFTELKRGIGVISQRMLTATLRGLERDGLVTRTVYPVVPPRVDYELTPLGQSLLATVCALMSWTFEHLDEIDQAREEYDARTSHYTHEPARTP